jgi:aldehyde dehydrogenase (NAD+)
MTTTDVADWKATPIEEIAGKVEAARAAYAAGRTRPRSWRATTLRAIRDGLERHEDDLLDAMAADLGRPRFEGYGYDVGFCIADIDHTLDNLRSWMKPRRVRTPMAFKPGASHLVPEPLGVVAVISPWNYPVQLLIMPVVAAIAAGNAVVAKPSELAPATAEVLERLLRELDDPAIQVVEGGVAETTELLAQRFDHIIYTGNGRVGRVVMKAAAEHLTPVTLELGGKSPAIVSRHADVDVAAKRIAWGKFVNAGQTCIAPDYVLVDRAVHDRLVERMADWVREFYGEDPKASPDYGRIVNAPHFHRLEKLLDAGDVAVGGDTDPDERYIAPTIVTGVTRDDPVMDEEIFGPVLPVLAVDDLDEAVTFVNEDDKPLALYVFSGRKGETERVVAGTSSGGVCVNGTLLHVSNPDLPFGGVGESGMGAYHGKEGFDTFSHHRPVHTRTTKVDPPMLYPPYNAKKEKVVRLGFTLPDPRDLFKRIRARLSR